MRYVTARKSTAPNLNMDSKTREVMKDTFFFSHDFGARNDPKLQNVLMEHGCEGLGVFWCVVEQVYEQGGSLPLSSCKSIAFALHVECSVVESVVNDYALFESDGENFWSVSINNRLNKRAEIAQKRKNAAFNRWNKPQNNANAQGFQFYKSAIKRIDCYCYSFTNYVSILQTTFFFISYFNNK